MPQGPRVRPVRGSARRGAGEQQREEAAFAASAPARSPRGANPVRPQTEPSWRRVRWGHNATGQARRPAGARRGGAANKPRGQGGGRHTGGARRAPIAEQPGGRAARRAGRARGTLTQADWPQTQDRLTAVKREATRGQGRKSEGPQSSAAAHSRAPRKRSVHPRMQGYGPAETRPHLARAAATPRTLLAHAAKQAPRRAPHRSGR